MKSHKIFHASNKLTCIIGLASVLSLHAPTVAQADFLDDLFGGGASEPTAPAVRAPRPSRHVARPQASGGVSFSIRANDVRRTARKTNSPVAQDAANKESGGTKAQKTVFCATGVPARENPASAEVRLHDGTLRAGDSVVTTTGILVFRGRAACPHNAGDFVGLAQSKLPAAKRTALESLEHTMQAGRAPLVLEDKEAEPQVVSEAGH